MTASIATPTPVRMSVGRWLTLVLAGHIWRHVWLYAPIALSFAWAKDHYRVGVNVTESLPYSVFLVSLDERPSAPGDYLAFEWRRNQFYERHKLFMKKIVGVPGQTISVHGNDIFLDGKLVAHAKTESKKGVHLSPIEPGVIPAGSFFVLGEHPDSLDSRYSVTGLVAGDRALGRGYVLF